MGVSFLPPALTAKVDTMKHMLGWMMAAMLCFAAGAALAKEVQDARLLEAQAAFDAATKLRDEGRYSEARAQAEHALALREAVLGGAHPDVARCLSLLGQLHVRQGSLTHLKSLLQRALTIQEETLGPNHPDVAATLNHVGNLFKFQGLFDRAELVLQRSLAIREAALGPNHPDVAESLNNLALIYVNQGLYSRAEPLFQRALAISETSLGPNHPFVATLLNHFSILLTYQGLYDQAEPLLQRALAIHEAALGPHHPHIAQSLDNLANIYVKQGLHGRAEPLLWRALSIQEATLGPNHPETTYSLVSLSEIFQAQGLYNRAATLAQRALVVREAFYGSDRPGFAKSLSDLARIYLNQGRYSRAEQLYQRALAIEEASFGPDHPELAKILDPLAQVHLARHRLAEAIPLYSRALAISEKRLRREALDFSELRLARFLQHLRTQEEHLYALLRAHPGNAGIRRLALSAALLLKGRSVEETADISRAIYRSLDAEARDTFGRLRGLRTQRASLSLAGPGSLPPEEYQQRLQALSSEGDALEAELARRSAPLRALTDLPLPADIVDRVSASLPKDSALVEFIAYTDKPLVPKPGTPAAKLRGRLHYLALLLFPDGSTRALDLGPAAPIDHAASQLRDALARRDARFLPLAQALYRRAFRPLLPLLGTTRRLLLSPDGQLGLVPFDALHDGQRFLLDSFDFTYLTSGKNLLARPQDTLPASSVVVLADPDFKALPDAAPSAPGSTSPPAERSAALERFFSTSRTNLASTPWTPLPGSRLEAESLKSLLPQAQLFLGPEATKARLLHLPTPGILHVATHGFFLEDASVPKGSRAVAHFGVLGDGTLATPPPDPLLRSGLILAGARTPASDTARPALENALVTALELAGLNLWGTQLVVLSACDTGRGDVKLGQGVYGLRRAFIVAGAETVVMSLWKVNDAATRAFMDAYYRNLLEGQGRASALREAMRASRLSQAHPHYWAPFIAVGSDAPLRSLTPLHQPPPDTKPSEPH